MGHGNLLLLFALMLTCSTLANIKPKSHKNVTKSGQKRIDVQGKNDVINYYHTSIIFFRKCSCLLSIFGSYFVFIWLINQCHSNGYIYIYIK